MQQESNGTDDKFLLSEMYETKGSSHKYEVRVKICTLI